MTASPTVEARSLAELNLLAGNPPQYPENPTNDRHESLVLYISRVPGTRDVILSPFKPQMKNVTGEDVANSLYYVHLDLPTDDLISVPASVAGMPANAAALDGPSQGRSSGESADSRGQASQHFPQFPRQPLDAIPPQPASIPRKPVPTSARLPKLESHASEPVVSRTTTGVSADSSPMQGPTYQPNAANARELRTRAQTQMPPMAGDLDRPSLSLRTEQQAPPILATPINRRPLGPRPMGMADTPPSTPGRDLSPGFIEDARRGLPSSRSNMNRNEASPTRPIPTTPKAALVRPQFNSRSPSPAKTQYNRQSPSSSIPFSLTLIRRDPTTGHQWNIGKVSSYQSDQLLPFSPDMPPAGAEPHQHHPPINIHLETSGYAKFRGMPLRRSLDTRRPGSSASSTAAAIQAQVRRGSGGTDEDTNPAVFSRQIVMAFGKTWTSNLREKIRQRRDRARSTDETTAAARNPADYADLHLYPPPRPPLAVVHGRNASVNSVASEDSVVFRGHHDGWLSAQGAAGIYNDGGDGSGGRDSPPPLFITQPGPGLKPKGYMFESPWGGRCEFRTGKGGRSLKCRHVASYAGDSGGFNPLVLAQGLRDGNVAMGGGTLAAAAGISSGMPTSELRFNLPSSDLFRSRKTGSGYGESGISSTFDKLLRLQDHGPLKRLRRGSDDYDGEGDDGDDDDFLPDDGYDLDKPMDLSLGRERAGGGNRGKRAKLGKLILHDEGLKMMDLVVAANMGIWWGAWERSA